MRHLRLFAVSFLLTLALSGCHRKPVRVTPPPQTQPPIVTTLPPIPPLRLPDVNLVNVKPTPPTPKSVAPTPAPKQTAQKHHRHFLHRHPAEKTSAEAKADQGNAAATPESASTGSVVLGQLSAGDAAANPKQKADTENLIQLTENRLNKLSTSQQARHKDDIVQVKLFLKQAQQALNMNDLVGAQTLANKAKILMDDLSK